MARDRFGGFAEPATTPLQRYIQNACDPQNYEPNLALDLEIADLINSKKGTAPREAAIAIVTYANHRNPNVALLALTLLDICVKNCGYPFHLQISTKEFLNELVRRFPERPPLRYSRVQSKVLELIEEWRQTICQNSRYKDDLGFIRDMHRLLAYKGYMFPEVKREDAAVLNPSDVLKSADEMEEEERAAQSAKLQELIRRGTPHDLQEANKLMKIMAGYDNRHKTDYRAKAAEEVSKIQQKARILEEMLQEHKPEDNLNSVAWEELSNALASAQPKIQKMCEEESDDTEAVAKLFEINDSIHRTLERYRLVKSGDLEGASKIPRGTLGVSGAGVRHGVGNELSLIDFDEEDDKIQASSKTAGSRSNGNSLENDLLGLSIQENFSSEEPSISLGGPNFGSGMISTMSVHGKRESKPDTINSESNPNYDVFGIMDRPSYGDQVPRAQLTATDQVKTQVSSSQSSLSAFESLVRSDPSPASASLQQQSSQQQSVSGNSLVLSGFGDEHSSVSQVPTTSSVPQDSGSMIDEEWKFSSALPESNHEITVINTSIFVVFRIQIEGPSNTISINSSISNNTAQQISNLTFQLAVMKGYTLSLQPQSGRSLKPRQRGGITQSIWVHGDQIASGKPVKVRWKASYWVGGEQREEQGEVPSLTR